MTKKLKFCSFLLKKLKKKSEKNLNSAQFSQENLEFENSKKTNKVKKKKKLIFLKLIIQMILKKMNILWNCINVIFVNIQLIEIQILRDILIHVKSRKNEESKYKLLYEQNESEKKNLIEQHQKEKEMLYKHIDKLLEKVGHTTNNIQNNIILNNFGKEDLSHINNDFKAYLLKGPWTMIPRMIEKVHFDDKKPENKNILLPNKKEPYVKVFENAMEI